MDLKLEKTISSKIIHRGRAITCKVDDVELPSGRQTTRDVVEHPGAVAIIPILLDGRIVLVRQYRYAIGKELLEVPAGTLERGEEPADCAHRELREETGYDAGKMEKLMQFYVAPGYSSELIHIFVARNLRKVRREMELDEDIEVEAHESDEILRMIRESLIEDAKTICGILAFITIDK